MGYMRWRDVKDLRWSHIRYYLQEGRRIVEDGFRNAVINVPYVRYYLMNKENTTFEPIELKCYDSVLSAWWYQEGSMRWLHTLNEVRVPLIYNTYMSSCQTMRRHLTPVKELQDVRLLDIGCGGGVLTEALAELGFGMKGIDPNEKMIIMAKEHASHNRALKGRMCSYEHTTIEEFAAKNKNRYDGIILSEVLDHVVDKKRFLSECLVTLKPGGNIFITSKNRTGWSLLCILAASAFQTLPFRTQFWLTAESPERIEKILNSLDCSVKTIRGMSLGVLTCTFRLREDTIYWYYIQGVKKPPAKDEN